MEVIYLKMHLNVATNLIKLQLLYFSSRIRTTLPNGAVLLKQW
jgi:hypothetical protein